jgi:hypothetical protein
VDRGDLEREQDIEELRRVALAQHAQLQLLAELVEKQRRELGRSRGSSSSFQLTLKLLEELKAKAKKTQAALEKVDADKPAPRKPRSSTGPTRASSHGARSKAGAGASPYGHKREPTIPWVHVVPDFGGLLMKMSSGLATNRSHRRLSSFT